jgi:DNA-binding LacI/PurR family transcriptional regulator
VSTASLALRGGDRVAPETKARILEAARKLNYVPNELGRSMRRGRTHTIGIVIPQTTQRIFSHPFFTEVMGGVADVAVDAGYTVLLSVSSHDDGADAYTHLLESRRADGVILMAAPLDDRNALKLAASGLPVVFLGSWSHSPGVHSVCIDERAAAMSVVTHLVDQGYQRIAHLAGQHGHGPAIEREHGYRDALAAAGRAADPSLVARGDFSPESGRAAMLQLLEQGTPPDAVFAASDEMAIGALQVLNERSLRVPFDVALAGFDDIALSVMTSPPLTTVHYPMRELGSAAARLLLDEISGSADGPTRIVFPTPLIVRGSSVRSSESAEQPPVASDERGRKEV